MSKLKSRKFWLTATFAALCGILGAQGNMQALKYGVYMVLAYIIVEGVLDATKTIGKSVERAYAIPSVEEIVAAARKGEDGEEA